MSQIGQKSTYQSIKKIFKDIFNYCGNNEKFKEFQKYFLVEEIIQSGTKSLKDFRENDVRNVIDYF